jgi:hypothetical protein
MESTLSGIPKGDDTTPVTTAAKPTTGNPTPSKPNANDDATRTATSPARKDTRPAAPEKSAKAPAVVVVPPGLLSAYFLGGVGELWVDGKLFPYQPPFERANIAAGVHTIACRMTGDDSRRELIVNIVSGEETVIEYELGGTPVVVTD